MYGRFVSQVCWHCVGCAGPVDSVAELRDGAVGAIDGELMLRQMPSSTKLQS